MIVAAYAGTAFNIKLSELRTPLTSATPPARQLQVGQSFSGSPEDWGNFEAGPCENFESFGDFEQASGGEVPLEATRERGTSRIVTAAENPVRHT